MTRAPRDLRIGILFLGGLAVLGAAHSLLERTAAAAAKEAVQAPRFEVDPFWPKPLPNHWLLGSTIGISIARRDHVFTAHRGGATLNKDTGMGPPTPPRSAGEGCVPAPPVLEFDPAGNLVAHWGGPGEGYEWPASNHGITVDHKGN